MHKGRLEAFSDGVLAIVITIMVLEIKVPHGHGLNDLLPLVPKLVGYVLSFIYVGIYWNNHHHLFQAAKHVDGRVLWANLFTLFWLSLLPVATGWLSEAHFVAIWPAILYGVLLLGAGFGYSLVVRSLLRLHGNDSVLATALGRDVKGYVSLALYTVAIGISAMGLPVVGVGIYGLVALFWLVPDQRIEKRLKQIGLE